MTNEEKLTALKLAISPDTAADDILSATLLDAEALILNRMYPFGYDADKQIPTRYERLQIQLAVELYTHRGSEGQTGHSENGTSRTWPEKSRLLSGIMPHVGSVVSDA